MGAEFEGQAPWVLGTGSMGSCGVGAGGAVDGRRQGTGALQDMRTHSEIAPTPSSKSVIDSGRKGSEFEGQAPWVLAPWVLGTGSMGSCGVGAGGAVDGRRRGTGAFQDVRTPRMRNQSSTLFQAELGDPIPARVDLVPSSTLNSSEHFMRRC
jgi:hypothetical protein